MCEGVCVAASCADDTKNGDETDIDCGGGCGPCVYGAMCEGGVDCETEHCEGGLCDCPEGEDIASDGQTCIGVGECDGIMSCEHGANDLVFYGVVSQGDVAVGSVRCVQFAASGRVVCDTDPVTGKLVVSPVLWCEP